MVAEPLEKGLGEDMEKGKAGRCPVHGRPRAQSWQVSIEWNKRRMSDFFTKNYDWDSMQLDNLQSQSRAALRGAGEDLLASRSVWAFGPEVCGSERLTGSRASIQSLIDLEVNGPNVLVDDCLPSEAKFSPLERRGERSAASQNFVSQVNKSLLVQSKDS